MPTRSTLRETATQTTQKWTAGRPDGASARPARASTGTAERSEQSTTPVAPTEWDGRPRGRAAPYPRDCWRSCWRHATRLPGGGDCVEPGSPTGRTERSEQSTTLVAPTEWMGVAPGRASTNLEPILTATAGLAEGGVPIGGVLISEDGAVLGRGHNMRFQKGSAILHGEMSALENAGRLEGKVYKNCTMYTTLSPCHMCSGACLLYGVKRVVLGENVNFQGAEDLLRSKGVEVINLDNDECKELMSTFIKERPHDWFEDIGE